MYEINIFIEDVKKREKKKKTKKKNEEGQWKRQYV